MFCIVEKNSEDIQLKNGEVVFCIECDDGRSILIVGEYCERFALPAILQQIAAELPNATIQIARSSSN